MNNKLNAYVRFDGSGKIVPSSVILQRTKPKVGNWKQIDSSECCNYTSTTTSTTTTAALVNSTNAFVDCTAACNEACDEPFNYFDVWMTQECLDTFPTIGCAIWLNVEATVNFPNGTYNNGSGQCIVITDGIITNIV